MCGSTLKLSCWYKIIQWKNDYFKARCDCFVVSSMKDKSQFYDLDPNTIGNLPDHIRSSSLWRFRLYSGSPSKIDSLDVPPCNYVNPPKKQVQGRAGNLEFGQRANFLLKGIVRVWETFPHFSIIVLSSHTHTQTHKIKQQLEDGSAAVLFGSSEKCCGKLKVFISEGKSRGGLRKPIHEKFHLKLMRYNSMISPNYIKLQGNYLSHCAGCSVTSMERSCCWWGWSAGGNRRRGRGALRLAWQSKQLLKD